MAKESVVTTQHPEKIEELVCRTLAYAANTGRENISPRLDLLIFGIDSVGVAGICVVLEAELGVILSVEALTQHWPRWKVADLISLVYGQCGGAADSVAT